MNPSIFLLCIYLCNFYYATTYLFIYPCLSIYCELINQLFGYLFSGVGSNLTDAYINFRSKIQMYNEKLKGRINLAIATNNVANALWHTNHSRPMLVTLFADKYIKTEYLVV